MTTTDRAPRGLLFALSTAVVIGLVSLVLAVQNAFALNAQSDQREVERIAADYSGCVRGNAFREQTKSIGTAQETLIRQILETFLPAGAGSPERQAAVERINTKIEPAFTDFDTKLGEIKTFDCDVLYPGGRAAVAKAAKAK